MPVKTYAYKHVPGSQPLEADVHYSTDGLSVSKPIGE